MSLPADLSEALAWLDYCLEEAEAAMHTLRAAAVPALGMTCMNYHAICEMAAELTTFRGRCARWGAGMKNDG